MQHVSMMSETDYQMLMNSAFIGIADNNSGAIPVSGRLTLATKGYKLIDDIPVSPYQSLMFPLKRRKRQGSSRKSRKQSASGFRYVVAICQVLCLSLHLFFWCSLQSFCTPPFRPHLTIVPKSDSLDSITLDVRTSVTIQTGIPIKIRIVRLGKTLTAGVFKKKGSKSKLDLAKKGLMVALRRVVEGAPIVYERIGIAEGDVAPLPLDVLDSSHYHALLIQPINKREHNAWRDPVLLTKDFLFNPTNIRDVTRCHTLRYVLLFSSPVSLTCANLIV